LKTGSSILSATNAVNAARVDCDRRDNEKKAIADIEAIASYFDSISSSPAMLLVHDADGAGSEVVLARRSQTVQLSHWEFDYPHFVHGIGFTQEAWDKYLQAANIISEARGSSLSLAGYMADQGRVTNPKMHEYFREYFHRFFDDSDDATTSTLVGRFAGKPMTIVCCDAYRNLAEFLRQVASLRFKVNGNRTRRFRYLLFDFIGLMASYETKSIRGKWESAKDGSETESIRWAESMPTELQVHRLELATGFPVACTADLKRLMIAKGGFTADYIANEDWVPSDVLPIIEANVARAIDPTRSPEDILNEVWARFVLPDVKGDEETKPNDSDSQFISGWSDWVPKQDCRAHMEVTFETMMNRMKKPGFKWEVQEHPDTNRKFRWRKNPNWDGRTK
jgi:hypothetical protein